MKAITIQQPWATLIALGEKRFETRSRRTNIRGTIAIHAGKSIDRGACELEPIKSTLAKHGYTVDNLPTGAVIATVELIGSYRHYNTIDNGVHIVRCPDNQYDFEKVHYINGQEKSFGWWGEGRHAWEMANIKQIEPIPAKGQQGWWNFDLYELDPASKHLFCKCCGNNYLLHEHKKNCPFFKLDLG